MFNKLSTRNGQEITNLGVVLKVRMILQRNPRIRTSALWSGQLLSLMVLALEQFGMTWPCTNLSWKLEGAC